MIAENPTIFITLPDGKKITIETPFLPDVGKPIRIDDIIYIVSSRMMDIFKGKVYWYVTVI
jgi:hypothetical protein